MSSSLFGWEERYDDVLNLSRKQKKPLFLYFTGSDWCPWCQKMEKEILDTTEFQSQLASLFIFYKVDFPLNQSLSKEKLQLHHKLKNEYRIHEFPTVVLYESGKGIVARLSYLPIGAKNYAEYVKNILNEFFSFETALANHQTDLESLYKRAKEFGSEYYQEKITQEGLQTGNDLFFLFESYNTFIEEGKVDTKAARNLRADIIARDPKNIRGAHLQLAILDFQILANRGESPCKVIKPLAEYVDQFGKKDKENLWRLHLMMAQYLYSKELVKEALEQERRAYKVSPEILRKEVGDTISYLRKQASEF